MNSDFDGDLSLEQLEGQHWPERDSDATGLVKSVHSLRRRPVCSLKAHELARLIGQDVGLRWLLPVALEILRETAPEEAVGGFYDDDLLGAVLTRKPETWQEQPDLAHELRDILGMLTDLGEYVEPDAKRFLAMFRE
jgi:CDI immunity proteins